MANHASSTWTGASGMEYVYQVCTYPVSDPPEIGANEPGNFIYAKRDAQRRWIPIFFGRGDLTQVGAFDPQKIKCIESKDATHVHVRVNFDKESRIAEVKDLLANFPQALAPDGCNEQGSF